MPAVSNPTLRQLFRERPLAVGILEQALGSRFWPYLDQRLADFGAHSGVHPGDLLDRVGKLAAVPPDTDWDGKPLCYLIDYLSGEHREFRDRVLPRLRKTVNPEGLSSWPDRYALELFQQEFEAFSRAFLLHLVEEETGTYPGILHAESLLRHAAADPSARAQAADLLAADVFPPSRPDEELERTLSGIAEKLRLLPLSPAAASRRDAILADLREFHGRLERHARLESECLYPRVAALKAEASSRLGLPRNGQSGPKHRPAPGGPSRRPEIRGRAGE
jgi:iron-sulfur cluster repair protein YtfE (RIC family)